MGQQDAQATIVQAAKRQMGAGWGRNNPWDTIKAGPARFKPHKSQVNHSSCFAPYILTLSLILYLRPSIRTHQAAPPLATTFQNLA